MSTTRRTPRRRTSRAAPRKGRSSPARTHRPAAKTRTPARNAAPQARLPQIELTDGQRREGTGLLLIIVAALLTLSIVFSPGAGLTRVRGFLLDSVGLGWLAVVIIMAAGGISMIGGRRAAVDGETVRASRNPMAVFLGMALLSTSVLGLLQLLMLPPAEWVIHHQQAGGVVGSVVAGRLNDLLTAWGAAIVLSGLALFGAMLSFDLSLAALAERIRPALPEEVPVVPEPEGMPMAESGWPQKRHSESVVDKVPPAPLFPPLEEVAVEPPPPPVESGSPDILDAAEVERARAAAQAEWAAAAAAAHEADAEEERQVWLLPPLNLLDPMGSKHEKLQEEVKHNIELIESTLASFGVAARVRGVNSGASVTQYELEPAKGVPVRKITALQNDLSLALAAPIRIQAPIPGKPAVGLEVPNKASALVTLREIIRPAGGLPAPPHT